MTRGRTHTRRAFSLLEAVVAIVVLAISVPATVSWLGESAARRADAVNAVRASSLATGVMETILADVASPHASLGFGALASEATYLDTPATGLRARLAPMSDGYAALGFTYDVDIGPLVDSAGAVNADAGLNIFRVVGVRVTFPSQADSTPIDVRIEAMVTSL
ncbi:MAG: hypothetical protein SFY69_13320 [Planctomycetota bacterium]|nr:hypothetical protein [Planctomycetota bacterium]